MKIRVQSVEKRTVRAGAKVDPAKKRMFFAMEKYFLLPGPFNG